MTTKEYCAFIFKQRTDSNVPQFCIFHAPVGDVLEWADIKRLEDTPGAAQRRTSPAKVKSVAKFIGEDDRNSIPTSLVLTLELPIENIESIDTPCTSGADNILARIKINYDQTAGSIKPGLIIDGQHRLYGLNSCNSDLHVSIVALLNVTDDEKAFQFLVINNKASKVSSDHIRALALSYSQEQLRERLKSARLSLDPNLDFVGLVNTEDCSPFQGIISWPTNIEENRIVVPAAIETAINKIQLKRVKPLEGSDDILLEYFYAIWNTIKCEWQTIWNKESRLLSKIGIVCMTEYITDALVSSYDWGRLDISDPTEVANNVKELLKYQEKDFWTVQWNTSSLDTKAGRDLIVDALVKIGRNMRGGDSWHEDISLVDLTE